MLSWEWRWSWSSADRRCSNYIWVINNFIANSGASYIKRFDGTQSTYGCQLKRSLAINSLATGRCDNNFKSVIFKLITQNSSLGTHCDIALRRVPQNLTIEKSTLVQVMAWYLQATSHYLSQCWPRWYMSPYSSTRPKMNYSLTPSLAVWYKTQVGYSQNFGHYCNQPFYEIEVEQLKCNISANVNHNIL